MKKEDIKKILEGLDVSDEQIGKIIAISESETSVLSGDVAALKGQLSDRDKDIEALKKAAEKGEEVTKQLTELQGKYEADTKALQQQIDQRNYMDAVRTAVADKGIKFTSKAAESYYMSQAESKQLKLENGRLIGFDDFHNAMFEADKGAFVQPEPSGENKPAASPAAFFSGPAGQTTTPSATPAMIAAQRFNAAHGINSPLQAAPQNAQAAK